MASQDLDDLRNHNDEANGSLVFPSGIEVQLKERIIEGKKFQFIELCKHFAYSQNPRKQSEIVFLDCALSIDEDLIPDKLSLRDEAWTFYHTFYLSPQVDFPREPLYEYADEWRKRFGGRYSKAESNRDFD